MAITPAYNEEQTIGQLVTEVRGIGLPSVVVDDGSADRTAGIARQMGAVVIRLPVNLGVGAALRAGFRYAVRHGYRRVVQIDADLQHDPSSIPLLFDEANRGVHLVIGSRFADGYTAGVRRPAMRVLSSLVARRTGVELSDPSSGFKVVSEPLLSYFAEEYPSDYLGDTIEALILAADFGARIGEVDVPMRQRASGSPTSSLAALAHFGRVLFAMGVGKPGVPLR